MVDDSVKWPIEPSTSLVELDRINKLTKLNTIAQSCGSCRFWNKEPLQPHTGACRVVHPAAMLMPVPGGIQLGGVFPPTKDTDWCGEYERRLV